MIRNQTNQIVIRPRVSTHLRVALIATAVVILVALIFGSYWQGQSQAREALTATRGEVERLTQSVERLTQHQSKLQTSLIQAERQLQVDKVAYRELSAILDSSRSQISELRNEIKFYRSIISPEDGKSGIRIQDFLISATPEQDQFRYKLVLIQALQHNKEIKGTVGFEIKGSENGTPKTIQLPIRGAKKIHVNFKYFQNLVGTLSLPPGFEPREVKVSVVSSARNAPVTERSYPWPSV